MTDESEIRRRVQLLTEKEARVLGLIGLGWGNEQIAKHFRNSVDTIKTHVRRISKKLRIENGRVALALFYVEYVLPSDCRPNFRPGEKRDLWRNRAEELRAHVRRAGVLDSQVVAAVTVIARIENAGRSADDLGKLMGKYGGMPVSGHAFKAHLSKVSKCLPGPSTRARIAVIAWLAPFDAE